MSADPRYILLYDGNCVFCDRQTRRVLRWARRGAVQRVSYHDPEATRGLPELDHERLQQAMHLVDRESGRIRVGVDAVCGVLGTRPVWRCMTWLYYVPGLRAIFDRAYKWIAAHRYGLSGSRNGPDCQSGACRRQ